MSPAVLYGGVAALLLLGATQVHGALAWLVSAPFVLHSRTSASWRAACVATTSFAVGTALAGNAPWVKATAQQYFGLSPATAATSVVILAIVSGVSFGILLGVLQACALRMPPVIAMVALGAAWSVWETLLLSILPHYPWVSLAATQAAFPMVMQVVSGGGQAGLSFAIAMAGSAFGFALRSGTPPHVAIRFAAVGVAIVGAVVLTGWVRLGEPSLPDTPCTLAAIDASIPSGTLPLDETLARYGRLSAEAVQRRPSVLVWPESAVPASPETDPDVRRQLEALVETWGIPLLTGASRIAWSPSWEPRLFNSVYLIKAGHPLQYGDKRRPVPFAEYWPLPFPRPNWFVAEEVSPGSRPTVFAIGKCRLGVLICFEADHPALARDLVEAGAQALLILSNDAQLAPRAVDNEVVQARLRAIETGLPVVRVANRGDSVMIDRFGQIRHHGAGGVLVTALPAAEPAPAVRWGPRLIGACWCLVVVAVGGALLRRVRGYSQRLPKLS